MEVGLARNYNRGKEDNNNQNKVDMVNNPPHYTQGGIECIDAMEAAYGTEAVIMFCMCNAFKYQWRFNRKNGREDILKCQWYQNKMVQLPVPGCQHHD